MGYLFRGSVAPRFHLGYSQSAFYPIVSGAHCSFFPAHGLRSNTGRYLFRFLRLDGNSTEIREQQTSPLTSVPFSCIFLTASISISSILKRMTNCKSYVADHKGADDKNLRY